MLKRVQTRQGASVFTPVGQGALEKRLFDVIGELRRSLGKEQTSDGSLGLQRQSFPWSLR